MTEDKEKDGEWTAIETEKSTDVKAEETSPQETEPKEDEYSKRVAKRIAKITRQRNEIGEELERERVEKARLQQELEQLRRGVVKQTTTGIDAMLSQAEQNYELAKKAYNAAFDSGDKDAQTVAMEQMFEARANIRDLRAKKAEIPADTGKEVPKEEPKPRQNNLHPKAAAWIRENGEWFGKDRVATAAALAKASELEQDGYDPGSDDYYEKLELDLSKRFPEYFKDGEIEGDEVKEEKVARRATVSSGVRAPAPKGGKTITLSESERRMARRMGLSEKDYALEKAKLAEARGDYVEIDTRRRANG